MGYLFVVSVKSKCNWIYNIVNYKVLYLCMYMMNYILYNHEKINIMLVFSPSINNDQKLKVIYIALPLDYSYNIS